MSDYAKSVSEYIIRQLEQGTAPWLKPWQAGERYLPFNAVSGNAYKGMNAVWLLAVAEFRGYGDTRWMTYKQATDLDAQVNKGEKGTMIQFWKWQDEILKRDEAGNPVLEEDGKPVKVLVRLQRPQVRSAIVFNAQQISGLPALEVKAAMNEWERHAEAEAILKESGAIIQHVGGDRAFYRPSSDSITLPLREQFPTADRYYATALHELGHWSGHESRLNRDILHPFGSIGYAKEELRAEIASLMMGEQLGIGHDPAQHTAYIASWIQALQEDPREIFRASADAERIVHYLHGREMHQEQTQEQFSVPQQQIQVPVLAIEPKEPAMPERVYLDVPYAEKNQAKALGAAWDREAKAWYVGPKGDKEALLARWGKANTVTQPELDPFTEFAQALEGAGLLLQGIPIMDGELRRVSVEGDAKGERSGAYVGFTDGRPAGYIQNHKTGLETTWKATQRTPLLTNQDRERLEAEATEKRTIRANEREALATQTAALVETHWLTGEPATSDHPYLAAKGVQAYGLRINTLGTLALSGGKTDETPQQWSNTGELLVPVLDQTGRFWAAQSIDASGRKSFPRGGKLQGGHCPIGDMSKSDTILIAEGYATAATLHQLTGLPVIVAFNSGNLPTVAGLYREQYPEKILVMAGDNDHLKPPEKNVGRLKAQEAAQMVGGMALLPDFEKDAPGSDWNDFWKAKGTPHTQAALQLGINRAKTQKQVSQEHQQALEKQIKVSLTLAPEKLQVQAEGRSLNR